LIASGKKSHTRRNAYWPRNITVGASDSVVRYRIDVRCLEIFASIDAKIAVALVIREDQNDIGLSFRPGALDTSRDRSQRDGEGDPCGNSPKEVTAAHGIRTRWLFRYHEDSLAAVGTEIKVYEAVGMV
jgi:hypothetical protein